MSTIPFQLIPFGAGDSAPGSGRETLEITGTLAISDGTLQITYRLRGDLGALAIAPPASQPERRDQLWQTTCLEVFLARPGQDDYWEYNLSSAGHWNVYHLDGYRRGLAPEPAYTQLPFQVQYDATQLTLVLQCPLPPAVTEGALAEPERQQGATRRLELGITAVVQACDGSLSYWALSHPGPEADFHRREGFSLQVP
jgi:hypothetical protein